MHILNEPVLVPDVSKETAVTLQKFNSETFEAIEVHATLSQIDHVQHPFCKARSAHVAVL